MTDKELIEALNQMLEQEHACAIRYATHAAIVSGPYSETVAARLKEIATAADPTTRTYAVTLAFDVPESFIVLPGMTAKAIVRVAADGDGAVRIPALR